MTLNFEATLRPMVAEVARQVSFKFPRTVLREDVEQDIWLWALSNRDSITRTIEAHPETWIEQIASTMRKQALSFGAAERAAAEQYEQEDFHKYSYQEVKTLLPDIFEYEDWQSFSTFGDSQPRGKSQTNTTGDRLASLVDVRDKVLKLNNDQYNAIVWHYKYGHSFEVLAEEYGITSEAARKRVERAVKAVQRALGPVPQQEYTGRRSVRSNAAWRAASDSYYQEG